MSGLVSYVALAPHVLLGALLVLLAALVLTPLGRLIDERGLREVAADQKVQLVAFNRKLRVSQIIAVVSLWDFAWSLRISSCTSQPTGFMGS